MASQWLALHKVAHVSADHQSNGFSVSRASPSSLINRLTVSAQLQVAGSPPRVLAADLSAGLFLLPAAGKFYRVLDAANPTVTYRVPARSGPDPASLGVIRVGADGFMVVGFQYNGGVQDDGTASLHCYLPDTPGSGRWIAKRVDNPRRTRTSWAFVDVIAHDGRLCWVQMLRTSNATSALPLLICDNPFDDEPNLVFYRGSDSTLALCPLPSREACWNGNNASSSVARSRCVQVAGGKLRWVQMACRHAKESQQRGDAPTVLMSTFLEDPKTGETEWSGVPHLRMSFADVWDHDSYKKTGLPREDPAAVVLIDPGKPSVVYFSLRGHIFGVDMLDNMVVECKPHGMPEPDQDVSASSILAWVPPPALWGLLTEPAPQQQQQQQPQAATGEAFGSGGVKRRKVSSASS